MPLTMLDQKDMENLLSSLCFAAAVAISTAKRCGLDNEEKRMAKLEAKSYYDTLQKIHASMGEKGRGLKEQTAKMTKIDTAVLLELADQWDKDKSKRNQNNDAQTI